MSSNMTYSSRCMLGCSSLSQYAVLVPPNPPPMIATRTAWVTVHDARANSSVVYVRRIRIACTSVRKQLCIEVSVQIVIRLCQSSKSVLHRVTIAWPASGGFESSLGEDRIHRSLDAGKEGSKTQ